jgi:integral membrane sensor domain MASE1
MVFIKLLVAAFIVSITLFVILAIGENTATKNIYPKFTKWWRGNVIGIED